MSDKQQEEKKEEKDSRSRLKEKLEQCERERKEYLDGWKRARADFINYKKEEKKRMEDFLKFAATDLIVDMLSVVDSFERAEAGLSEQEKRKEEVKGLLKIGEQINDFLEKEGVEEVKVEGQRFDPGVAEAVEEVESEKEPGTVVEVVRKGYRLHNRLIRAAKVKVSKEPDHQN